MISPLILLIIAVRGKISPRLRSHLFTACFLGLFLPFQRSAIYSSDTFFRFLRHIAQAGLKIPNLPWNGAPIDIFKAISIVWLIGFLLFYVSRNRDYQKTIKMFREGNVELCASYFHRFRSRIYLPPDFETTYTAEEQVMLLAHERQHIAQRDPLLYRLLVVLECACWFNPLVSIAVKHFQHERELLCDEQVTTSYPKYDYGLLILKALEMKPSVRSTTAGIVIGFGSTSERLTAILKPMRTVGKWTAVALICAAALQLSIGFIGFKPAWRSLHEFSPAILEDELKIKEVVVSEIESTETPLNEGTRIDHMSAFISATEDGFTVDEAGLYDYALSLGLTEESYLRVEHFNLLRLDIGGAILNRENLDFQVGELKTEEKSLRYTEDRDLFMIFTDLFV
jgi:beta-lactamase regulating signal transducer with metallopeptidase domain